MIFLNLIIISKNVRNANKYKIEGFIIKELYCKKIIIKFEFIAIN